MQQVDLHLFRSSSRRVLSRASDWAPKKAPISQLGFAKIPLNSMGDGAGPQRAKPPVFSAPCVEPTRGRLPSVSHSDISGGRKKKKEGKYTLPTGPNVNTTGYCNTV